MKKQISIITLITLMSASAFAEGYQVNMLSAKQSAMGHVGVAMKLGAESMHFNPAGMAFLNETAHFSVGASGIFSEAMYSHNGYKASTDNDMSTPLFAYAAFSITDYLKAGISVTTPYGNGLDWGEEWKGSALVQNINLQSFSYQPTLSWKVTDNFSIGAGMMIMHGNFSLSRSMLHGSALGALAGALPPAMGGSLAPLLDEYKDRNLLSATLEGDSRVAVGFNVGLMWDINEKVSIGASYRSKVQMKVKDGEAELDYIDDVIEGLAGKLPPGLIPPLEEGTFTAALPLPANLTVGVSYRPNTRLQLAMDLQMVGWSAYQNLTVQFSEEVLNGYSIVAAKKYKDTFIARLGAEYKLAEHWDLRAGTYFDQTPVNKDYYNPETPGMNKIGAAVGFTYRPFEGFGIDFAATYIHGLGNEGSYPLDNKGNRFAGEYGSTAFAPTIGLSYTF